MLTRCRLPLFAALLIAAFPGRIGHGSELSLITLYSTPDKIISTLASGRDNFTSNYIVAGAYREKKQLKNAILYYANSCFKNRYNFNLRLFPGPVYSFVSSSSSWSPYYNDAVSAIASIFYEYSEYRYVIKFVDLVADDGSVLYRDANILKARALVKLKKNRDAISVLLHLLDKYKDSGSAALINIRLGSTCEDISDDPSAAVYYLRSLSSGSPLWLKNIAAKRLVFIYEKKETKPGMDSLALLAETLFDSGDYEMSEKYCNTVLKKKYEKNAAVTMLKVYTVTDYNAAVKYLAKMESNPDYYNLLLVHSQILWDKNRKKNALKNFLILAEAKDRDIVKTALPYIITYYKNSGGPEFINFAERYCSLFPEGDRAAEFLWLCGRYCIRTGDPGKASAYLSEAVNKYPGDSYSANCRYWLHRLGSPVTGAPAGEALLADLVFYNPGSPFTLMLLSEKSSGADRQQLEKKYKEAKNSGNMKLMLLYHTLLFLKSGYTSEVSARLNNFDKSLISEYSDIHRVISNPIYRSRYGRRISGLEKYFAAGDTAGIIREMEGIPENDENARHDVDLAFTVFSGKYGFYNYGTYYGFRLLDDYGAKENLSLLPENFVKILYPAPFENCTDEECKKYGIDKALVFSMIKTESNFNHLAKSPAGAMGLMQLMPSTSAGIARELKVKKYSMYDPCTSIRFGIHYLAWLRKHYSDKTEYIVSAYNAGAANIDKWLTSGKYSDMDFFSEFIPFAETRSYIYRTKKCIVQYKSIYRW